MIYGSARSVIQRTEIPVLNAVTAVIRLYNRCGDDLRKYHTFENGIGGKKANNQTDGFVSVRSANATKEPEGTDAANEVVEYKTSILNNQIPDKEYDFSELSEFEQEKVK